MCSVLAHAADQYVSNLYRWLANVAIGTASRVELLELAVDAGSVIRFYVGSKAKAALNTFGGAGSFDRCKWSALAFSLALALRSFP